MAVVALPALIGLAGVEGAFAIGVATAVGAYIDQRYIYPALFPADDQIGPKLNDLRLTTAEEGASFARVFGPAVRVPGVVIWSSPNIEHRDTTNTGKGGSGGNFVVYTYSIYVDVAFAAKGDTQTQALELDGIEQLYADGKKIWDRDPDILIDLLVDITEVHTFFEFDGSNFVARHHYMTLRAGVGDFNLNELATGSQILVSGFVGGNITNNSTGFSNPITVYSTAYGSGADIGKTFVTLRRVSQPGGFGAFVTSGGSTGLTVNLSQGNPRFSPNAMLSDPTFYTGTETQIHDVWHETYEGVGNSPGFRGLAHAMFQKLQLQDYGNRIPTFEAIVSGQASMTIGECISQICQERDIPASLIDVSLCTELIGGYAVIGPTSGVAMLQPLLVFYDIIPQMRGEVLHFFPRAQAPVVAIAEEDLAVSESGNDDAPRKVQVIDSDDLELPTELKVTYQDPERHYQTGGQTARISNRVARVQSQINFDLVATSAQGRSAAERLLRRAHQGARRLAFWIPMSYIGTVRESTICTFTADGRDWSILVDRVDRGENYQLRCEGVDEDVRLAVQFGAADIGSGPIEFANGAPSQGAATSPGLVVFEVLDNFLLRDEDADVPGFYGAACMSQFGMPFKGAVWMMSTDEGGVDDLGNPTEEGKTYNEIARSVLAATIGHSETILDAAAIPGFLDTTSVLDVTLYNGTFESVTALQCDRGSNRLCVGQELIGFETKEYLGDNRWRLTNLHRGLQGTEAFVSTHIAFERCVLVSGPGIIFIPINAAAIGTTRSFKCVGVGTRLEEVDPFDVTLFGANVRPLAPINISATRDVSDNLTVNFESRSRAVSVPFGASTPTHEPDPSVLVKVVHPTDSTTFVREFIVAPADPSELSLQFAYSAADQTADGYTPGDPVDVEVVQLSSWLGYGAATTATI